MTRLLNILLCLFCILLLPSCKGRTYHFPSNIANTFCLDVISIEDPLLFVYDSSKLYVGSERFLNYIKTENPDSSIFLYPIVKREDYHMEDWCFSDYESEHERKSFDRMKYDNERFLCWDFFDLKHTTESGIRLYDFKIRPTCFLLMLIPDNHYYWPPDSDVCADMPSKQRSLKVLPIYSRLQRKRLIRMEISRDWFEAEGGFIYPLCIDENPEDWISK